MKKSPALKKSSEKKVKIYTTPTCTYCHLAKEFFKENKVKYEVVDVTKDQKFVDELMRKSGQLGVPVIEVDSEIIVGFDREALKRALKLK